MPGKMPRKGVDPATGLRKDGRRGAPFRCVCGKSAFVTRRHARHSMKATFPGESMQVYRCTRSPINAWHFGHSWGHERTA